jgi:ribonucleotide monophosphatase NagD (HAD superfamily)
MGVTVAIDEILTSAQATASFLQSRAGAGASGARVFPIGEDGVLQALASAGGLNPYAHDDGIYVLRKSKNSDMPERIRFDYELLSRAEGKAAGFRLRGSDVIVVE